ncbi:mCG1050263, partial [Mus musculus]
EYYHCGGRSVEAPSWKSN